METSKCSLAKTKNANSNTNKNTKFVLQIQIQKHLGKEGQELHCGQEVVLTNPHKNTKKCIIFLRSWKDYFESQEAQHS